MAKIGTVNGLLLIPVAYTVNGPEEAIRIISARRVTQQERVEYEEASEV